MNSDSNANVDRNGMERREVPPVGGTSFETIILAVAIAAMVFALDLIAPLGVAGGVPYVALVLFGSRFEERSAVFFLAVAGSILTFLGYFFSPVGGIGWVVFTNRAYALFGIWATAVVLWVTWRERAFRGHPAMEEEWHGYKTILSMGREGFFVSVLVIVIGASSWGVISRIEEGAKTDIGKSLETALESSHASIRNQFYSQKKAAIIWASHAQIQMAVIELAGLPADAAALVDSRPQKNLRAWLTPALKTIGYRGFFVIGKDNINLASSRDGNVGVVSLLAKQGDFLNRVWAGETLVSLPQVSDVPLKDATGEMIENLPTMFVATPIKGAAGEIISILAFRIEPDEIFMPIFEHGHFGDSGETYAFDRKGLLISESRFKDNLRQIGLLTSKHSDLSIEIRDPGVNMVLGGKPSLPRDKQPLTRMAQSATGGESGSGLEGYRDYRGVPVVGAWLWDDELGFGIATEIDVEEAYAFSNNMRFVIVAFSALCIGIVVVLAMVSSRTRKRIALSEERFQHFTEVSSDFYWEMDENLKFSSLSDRFTEVTGLPVDELLGKTREETGIPGVDPHDLEKHLDDLRAHRAVAGFIHFSTHSNGQVVWLSISGKPVFGADGAFLGYRGTGTDITERKKAEKALQDSEERFRSAFENIAMGNIVINDKGIIETFNATAENIFGYLAEEVIGQSVNMLMPEPDRKKHDGYIRKYLETGKTKIIGIGREVTGLRKNGEKFPMHLGVGEIRIGDKVSFVGSISDLTKVKALETQLAQSQKMEAVGQLTGGVAHDFNNLLAIIMGDLECLDQTSKENSEFDESIASAFAAVERGSKLTYQLLAFSRQQNLNPEVSEPKTLIFDTIGLLQRTLGEDIDIRTAFATDAGLIKVDPGMLGNAVLNLALNARDAMLKGGTLTIKIANVSLDSEVLYDNQSPLTGLHVLISVADNGAGIKKKDLKHVFEPFFTTKDVGEGSGLGLSMVYGFVKQSGGHVTIDSKKGKGTTVNLYFPVAENLTADAEADAKTSEFELKGTETILVVEDDEDVRRSTVRMLNSLGYQVLEAKDGPSALKVLGKSGNGVDLVYSDVIMPSGMNGIELANELGRHYKGIKVLLTSGYPDKIIGTDDFDEIGVELLSKPYRREQLAKKLRATLD